MTASPANSPRTNPTRTNNPRDQDAGTSRSGSERSTASEQGIGIAEGADALIRGQDNLGQGSNNLAKLSQVIQVVISYCHIKICNELSKAKLIHEILQNYHTKAALILLQSRVSLPPAYAKGSDTRRVNKWVCAPTLTCLVIAAIQSQC